MPAVEVINLKDGDDVAIARQQRRLVRVGRPSPWGNPFHQDAGERRFKVRDREEALAKYAAWLPTQTGLIERAKRELRGKVLGCWCKPQRCHADMLAKIVNEAHPGDARVPAPKPPPSPEELREKATRESPVTKIGPVPAEVVATTLMGAPYDPKLFGARCDECPLKGRHTPVPPAYAAAGPSETRLVIVGEGPGRMEIVDGKPFTGPSGQMLNMLLTKAGISRTECHVTNAAACRGDTDGEKERAAACCSARLSNEMVGLPAAAPILALGAPAMKVMLGKSGILKTRGLVWKLPVIDPAKVRAAERSLEKRKAAGLKKFAAAIDRSEQSLWRAQARAPLAGRICIPSIHPAFVLRGGEHYMPMLRVDVKRAVRAALGGPLHLLDEGPFEVAHTAAELREKLKQIRTESVLIDVETLGPEPLIDKMTMLGISEVPDGEIVKDEDVRVVLASPWRRDMGKVLDDFCRTHIAGGHNFATFDMLVLKRYGVRPKRIFDSLIAHHTFASHLRQGLDHLGSMYVDTGPWKVAFKAKGAEEKGGVQSRWMSSADLDKYNCVFTGTPVVLADGTTMKIQDIVRRRLPVDVLSLGPAGIEIKRVTGWHHQRVRDQAWIRIQTTQTEVARGKGSRGLVTTPEHRIHTRRGWIEARDVVPGDELALPERALAPEEISALLGTLIGDSSMSVSPTWRRSPARAPTASVTGSHTDSCLLAQMKMSALRGFITVAAEATMNPSGFDGAPARRYSTMMSPQVQALRTLVYDETGAKRLRASLLDQLGPVGLAWWFMDDGCLQRGRVTRRVGGRKGRKGYRGRKETRDAPSNDTITLATNCFSRADIDEALRWFHTHFGQAWAGKDRVIRLGRESSRAFCALMAPYVFPQQRYKMPRHTQWPAWVEAPLAVTNDPHYARVVQAGAYEPAYAPSRVKAGHPNYMREARWCLTVEDNHNFFTPAGLVANCADVRINGVAWRRLQPDLESEQSVYEGDMVSASICRSMATAGFAFDQVQADELSAKLKFRAGALLGQMRTLLEKPGFHPARPQDLRAALFGQLKVRPIAITATGLASTASGTLEQVKNPETRAGKLADLILRWRATQKTRKTFIANIKPHKDGRVHPSWKAFGTVTGRFSCSRPNLMNLPRWSRKLEDRVRELYRAADGHVLIYFDLSQSEMRMAAYLSGDENFIQSCESGDVHTSNAKILFPQARDVLEKDPKGKYCPRHGEEGDAKSECNCGKEFRDVAKNAGFGILYQADSETIFKFLRSQGKDVTLSDVEAMFAQIHKVYARYYEFCDENLRFCKQQGHLREFFSHRIRWFGWYPSITDTSNYPVQGGIAALMNMRLAQIHPKLPKGARFVAQIHDACITEAKGTLRVEEKKDKDGKPVLGKDGKPVKVTILEGPVAQSAVKLIKDTWAQKIITPTNGKEWVMPIDLKFGTRWSDFG